MNTDAHITLALSQLVPSQTNPRTTFPEEKINELAESIRAEGRVLTDLWVRPAWCVGWKGGELPAEQPLEPYEIIAGECRYRSATIAKIQSVPCKVMIVSDQRCLELQLIENLQRGDLTPLEEAAGYERMLALRDAAGEPLYTVEKIAKAIGRTKHVVYDRLKLLNVPKAARDALQRGDISASTAALIGRIPDPDIREAATKEIVIGYGDEDEPMPLSVHEAQEYIARSCMRTLQGASFDIRDENLLADMPACVKCPHMTANAKESGSTARGDSCLNPACFKRKEEAAFEIFRARQAGDGKRVLTLEENSRSVSGDNFRTWSTNIVPLDEKPSLGQLKPDAKCTKTWRQLIAGQVVEIIVGRNEEGEPIEGVDVKLAIAAANQNGHGELFPSGLGEMEDLKEKQKKELAAKKRRKEVAIQVGGMIAEKVAATPALTLEECLRRIALTACDMRFFSDPLMRVEDFCSRKRREFRQDLEGKDAEKARVAAAQMLFAGTIDWENEPGPAGRELLKDLGIDWGKLLREEGAKEKKSTKEKAEKKRKAEIAKSRPAPEILAGIGARAAEITFDPKTHLFHVQDELGSFEKSPRTAFCQGWNDVRCKVERDLAKVPGWGTLHVAAYKLGQAQAKEPEGWPDMAAVGEFTRRELERVKTAKAEGCETIVKAAEHLSMDLDSATWLFDALVDLKHDALEAAAVVEKPTKKKAKAKAAAEPPSAPPAAAEKPAKAIKKPKAGKIGEQIREALEQAGPEGMSVKELSALLGAKPQNIHVWFTTSGKKQGWCSKIGEARYAYLGEASTEKEAA